MEIDYANNKIKKQCTNYSIAKKELGKTIADKLVIRINQISSAASVEDLIRFRIGGCHELYGDLKNKYAMDLNKNYRLILSKKDNNTIRIQIVIIEDIIDYH